MKAIEIERENSGRLKISLPYNPDYIAKIKAIEGYRWHPQGKYWSLPCSELGTVLSTFDGEKVVIDPSIYVDVLKKELASGKYSPRTIKLYIHYNGG